MQDITKKIKNFDIKRIDSGIQFVDLEEDGKSFVLSQQQIKILQFLYDTDNRIRMPRINNISVSRKLLREKFYESTDDKEVLTSSQRASFSRSMRRLNDLEFVKSETIKEYGMIDTLTPSGVILCSNLTDFGLFTPLSKQTWGTQKL